MALHLWSETERLRLFGAIVLPGTKENCSKVITLVGPAAEGCTLRNETMDARVN